MRGRHKGTAASARHCVVWPLRLGKHYCAALAASAAALAASAAAATALAAAAPAASAAEPTAAPTSEAAAPAAEAASLTAAPAVSAALAAASAALAAASAALEAALAAASAAEAAASAAGAGASIGAGAGAGAGSSFLPQAARDAAAIRAASTSDLFMLEVLSNKRCWCDPGFGKHRAVSFHRLPGPREKPSLNKPSGPFRSPKNYSDRLLQLRLTLMRKHHVQTKCHNPSVVAGKPVLERPIHS